MTPTLRIHLLGDFQIIVGDTPVTSITVPRLQSLLAYLVLHQSTPQDRSRLAFLLWPDSTEAQAHTNLRKLLYQLRQSFPTIDEYLQAEKHTLQWLPNDATTSWTLDVRDFERTLSQGEQGERSQNGVALRSALEQAMHLYRGDLLPSCYDEWILPERDRLHQLFLRAAERLVALLEQERYYDAAILAAQQLLRLDPLHELTYRQLMRLSALRGDRAAVLRVYHACVTVLERELGAEPSSVTRTLYESLLQSGSSSKVTTADPRTSRDAIAPLVGRRAEWRQLQEAWRKVVKGQPHVLLISGEAGIGKTRLAEEMETWVSRQDMVTARAHCHAAVGRLAYAPITAWLRIDTIQAGIPTLDPTWIAEVARLVPEVLAKQPKLPRPMTMTEGWQRQRFFEALARAVLNARQPLLLLLDDLQWCDEETLEWIAYLLRFEPNARLLLVGTVRADEISADHPLVTFLRALQRDSMITELSLEPLTIDETTTLAQHIAGQQIDVGMSGSLYRETEGNPLFVVEMMRVKVSEQQAKAQQPYRSKSLLLSQSASTLPPMVQSVLAARLSQLSPLARDVANVAAVIGREFTLSVLSHTCERSEDEVVRGLDELWQRRIVREQGGEMTETYDFSHDKLREQAYTSLSPIQRRRLHRRVAEVLEAMHAENLDAISGQVAAHYEHAGLPGQAIPYYLLAGETARQVYALSEAIPMFKHAAALLEAHSSELVLGEKQWRDATKVYTSLGNTISMMGRHQEARQFYQQAMTYVPPNEYIWQAGLQRKIASTWQHASDNPQDTSHANAHLAFREAERALEQAPDRTSSEWFQEWIQTQIEQLFPIRVSTDEMAARIEKARPIVEQYGTIDQRGDFLLAVNTCTLMRDRYIVTEETLASCRETLAINQQRGNRGTIGFSHFALGLCFLLTGRLDEAEEQLRIVLGIAEKGESAIMQVRCLTYLPFVFRFRGQVEQVRSIVTRAQTRPEAAKNSILAGHQAWIAWREGKLCEAETYGLASIEGQQVRKESNPFLWSGLWPLIGVMLVQGRIATATNYVRILLDPTQNPPPAQLRTLLESALHTWDAGRQEEACTFLKQATAIAEGNGYL